MKKLIVLLAIACASPVAAQSGPPVPDLTATRIDPVVDPAAIPLYPAMKQGAVVERWDRMFDGLKAVRNVTQPTLTPVLPDPAKANGAAVIVIPGGGFKFISMENEGWPVARWLADHGIAAFILKYRTNETPDDEKAMMAEMMKLFTGNGPSGPGPEARLSEPRATDDALVALRMVRARSGEWHIDPARVGMIGFSAGAMTALNSVLSPNAADRPDFFGYIYGPMLRVDVPANAPPMFAALALDDPLFGGQGFGIVEGWRAAHRPVELHGYEKGSHGFGMGHSGTTTTLLLDEFQLWLQSGGWLAKR
jgi:acetyl esterase/lipase